VTLTILDSSGETVRRFSSDETAMRPNAERYFADAWLQAPEALSASPGMHRFLWDLHYARPDAGRFGYSIAAVWGHGTPVEPEGPWALPGTYTVVLDAGGTRVTAPLTVLEDPRVNASPDDLQASLALSRKIDAALGEASDGHREETALREKLKARFPNIATIADASIKSAVEKLTAKPAAGTASFEDVAGALASIERALESADAAPTETQQQAFAEADGKLAAARSDWERMKAGPLVALNAALTRMGATPVEITEADKRKAEEPDPGEDLP
jgi:hypothetical protein